MSHFITILTAVIAIISSGCSRNHLQSTKPNIVTADSANIDTSVIIPRFQTESTTLRANIKTLPESEHVAIMRDQPFIYEDALLDESDILNPLNHAKNIDTISNNIDSINYVDPKILYSSALIKYYNQEYFDALEDLNKAIYENPNFSKAYYRRGECKSALGDFAGAMKDFENAANMDDLSIDIRKVAHLQCGVMREKLQKYGEAIVHYDLAIQMDSSYQDAYKRRAQTKEYLKDYEGAIIDYSKVMHFDSTNLKVQYKRGRSYHELGEYKKAIIDYDEVIKNKPNYTPAYFYRGMANYERKHYQEALKDYDKVVHLDPLDEEAHFDRGLVLFELNMYQEALLEFEIALELDAEDTDARINRALCKFHEGETDAAIREFNKVIKQDSNNIDAHINIGLIHMEKEQYTIAKPHFDQVIHIEPESPEAFYYRGMINYELNDLRSACLDFEMALKYNYPGALHLIHLYCNDKGGN